jgi:hypothetical protein
VPKKSSICSTDASCCGQHNTAGHWPAGLYSMYFDLFAPCQAKKLKRFSREKASPKAIYMPLVVRMRAELRMLHPRWFHGADYLVPWYGNGSRYSTCLKFLQDEACA